ncbi:hypothetical protein MTO96_005189 [Rhipicephalus appendiculatus]
MCSEWQCGRALDGWQPTWVRVRCSLAQRLLAEGDPRGCQRMLAPLMRWLHRPGNRALDWAGGRLRWLRSGDHVSLRSLAYLLAAQADYALKGSCCPALLDQVRCPLLGPRLAYFRALAGTDERQLWAALQRWPRDAPLWTLAGCRLASQGRWRSALQLLMRAVRLEESAEAFALRTERRTGHGPLEPGGRVWALWDSGRPRDAL